MDFEGIQVPHNLGPMVQKLNVPRENDLERELLTLTLACKDRRIETTIVLTTWIRAPHFCQQ